MANIFKPKRSSTAFSVPSTSNLADGEIAVNSADRIIYLREGSDIITIGKGTDIAGINTTGTSYFNILNVTGIPAFNGGTSGSSSPFTVDSTQVVANLNADLLDGQEGSYFLNTSSTTQTKTGGMNVHGDVYIVDYSSYTSSAALYVPVSSGTKGALTTKSVVSDSRAHLRFENSNGIVGGVTTSGTSTSFLTSSDYRLKENVSGITDGIYRIKQLKPIKFNFIFNQTDTEDDSFPGEVQTTASESPTLDGFLAHEVQTIVPEAVSGTHNEVDDDGNAVMQGIDQSKLVPLLTAALQEAIAKIEILESKVAALESA